MRWIFAVAALTLVARAQVPPSQHVWIITEENHSYESVIGNSAMPYFNSLASQYGLADQYYSPQHSSLTALMWLVAGQQVTDNSETTSCFAANNLVRQLLLQGYNWRSYQEDLPYAGFQGLYSGNYVRRHNPLIDFKDSCAPAQVDNSVPYQQLQSDVAKASLPNFAYITPDLEDDAHDGTLAAADAWLAQQVPVILSLPAFQPGGDGLLFIVWDEGGLNDTDDRCSARLSSGCGGRVATLVIGPQVRRGYQSQVLYTHTNVLRTICDAMELRECPQAAALANPMADFFDLVQISSPAAWQAVVSSPVRVQAQAVNDSPVYAMQVYVDNTLKFQNSGSSLDTTLALAPGTHNIVVQSWDTNGGVHKISRSIRVQGSALQIQSPTPNTVVASPVKIEVEGSGSATWREISVLVDGAAVARSAGNVLRTSLALRSGLHHITFEGTLTNGSHITQNAPINVSSKGVTITSPSSGSSVPSPVEIRGWATDPVSVSAVQIYVDNQLTYETSGFGVDFPLNLTGGTHSIAVQAWNAEGKTYKNDVSVNVLPVNIVLSSPKPGSVQSPVTISAVAESPRVVAMQLYIDNVLQYQSSGNRLQTSLNLAIGGHSLVVQAWDENGGVWKKEISITSK